MALMDRFKPYYMITVVCENCGKKCDVKVKKGTTVINAIKEGEIKCDNCYCNLYPSEYQTQWLK